MSRLLKVLHALSAAGFIGALAAQSAISRLEGDAAQQAIDAVSRDVAQPCLLMLVASGLLSLAVRPAFLEQRWLWGKGLLLILPAWWWHGPRAMSSGQPAPADRLWEGAALALSLAAFAVAVWRPRFGQARADGAGR